MRTLEFACTCGTRAEVSGGVNEELAAPICSECRVAMEWAPTTMGGAWFKHVPGKETGVYEHDWGKKATWDLTIPGKIERLERDGRIPRDPFKQHEEDVRSGRVAAYAGPNVEL